MLLIMQHQKLLLACKLTVYLSTINNTGLGADVNADLLDVGEVKHDRKSESC